jgi:hypothetical protein
MPNISSFYGIIIFMQHREHDPPHFHAEYGEYEACFDLKGNIREGKFPAKKKALVKAWAILHEEELQANWRLISLKLAPNKIDPLR